MNPVSKTAKKTLAPEEVQFGLDEALDNLAASAVEGDVCGMSPSQLVDHIESTHHVYLHEELPRLAALAREVALMHGEKDARLLQVHQTFVAMAIELWCHMLKEEQCAQ